ncbi:MAG: hypothetical protein R6X12_03930 [bacterium]
MPAERLARVLDWHLARYPLIRAVDVYKLIHQSVFGPGHIIADAGQARRSLDAEFAALRRRCCLTAVEPVEPLDAAGRLVRANLEPLREVVDAADRLMPVLLATVAEITGDAETMAARLAAALAWCRGKLAGEVEALAGLATAAALEGWPARHHSDVYVTAYRPAYRVVSATGWRASGLAAGPRPGSCAEPPPAGTSG